MAGRAYRRVPPGYRPPGACQGGVRQPSGLRRDSVCVCFVFVFYVIIFVMPDLTHPIVILNTALDYILGIGVVLGLIMGAIAIKVTRDSRANR